MEWEVDEEALKGYPAKRELMCTLFQKINILKMKVPEINVILDRVKNIPGNECDSNRIALIYWNQKGSNCPGVGGGGIVLGGNCPVGNCPL